MQAQQRRMREMEQEIAALQAEVGKITFPGYLLRCMPHLCCALFAPAWAASTVDL
jgi:hypothetical protein